MHTGATIAVAKDAIEMLMLAFFPDQTIKDLSKQSEESIYLLIYNISLSLISAIK